MRLNNTFGGVLSTVTLIDVLAELPTTSVAVSLVVWLPSEYLAIFHIIP
ncbi:MAG: hypothetical protein K0A89_12615 [ANME-2 cluster archaeon]|nr:hypothetical protein [ANME-2 cluster archaeon]